MQAFRQLKFGRRGRGRTDTSGKGRQTLILVGLPIPPLDDVLLKCAGANYAQPLMSGILDSNEQLLRFQGGYGYQIPSIPETCVVLHGRCCQLCRNGTMLRLDPP